MIFFDFLPNLFFLNVFFIFVWYHFYAVSMDILDPISYS